ncbi:MAG: MATE family multidrug resistance protein [Pseudohongiellaceae bacterium]|jgi:MATE family multidrug resistance protein|nr:MATE family efflux transporter [Pseudomonadota bacterium]MDA1289633.1 MATE family efflux transporter [Pseudomonadota bacterium]
MQNPDSITYRYLIEKAWPIILANAAVPLLGLVDTAVIGNVGTVTDLGAIAFGALIFSFVYWSFGFLRMGTTGSVAQALGAADQTEIRAVLGRALILAVTLGLMLIVMQWGIRLVALALLDGSAAVEEVTAQYFNIRIWGAPATLATFALMGVLIGLGNSRQLLLVQLFLNGLNISLDIYFAGVLDWGVEGIALGTIIAEWSTVIFAVWLIMRELNSRREPGSEFWPRSRLLDTAALKKMLAANRDIMIRTLLLVFSFGFFINQSAQFGDVVLAANHILLQLISFAAFFLDGYAFVVESLVGSSVGAKRRDSFDIAVKRSSILALVTATALALVLLLFGDLAVSVLTDLEPVQVAAQGSLFLAAIYIFFSFAAFQLDGIFIGASFTRQMRNAAFLSIAVFLAAWWILMDRFGVNGLWWAMIIYVAARADALLLFYPALRKSIDR